MVSGTWKPTFASPRIWLEKLPFVFEAVAGDALGAVFEFAGESIPPVALVPERGCGPRVRGTSVPARIKGSSTGGPTVTGEGLGVGLGRFELALVLALVLVLVFVLTDAGSRPPLRVGRVPK